MRFRTMHFGQVVVNGARHVSVLCIFGQVVLTSILVSLFAGQQAKGN